MFDKEFIDDLYNEVYSGKRFNGTKVRHLKNLRPDLYEKLITLVDDDFPSLKEKIRYVLSDGKLGYCCYCGKRTRYDLSKEGGFPIMHNKCKMKHFKRFNFDHEAIRQARLSGMTLKEIMNSDLVICKDTGHKMGCQKTLAGILEGINVEPVRRLKNGKDSSTEELKLQEFLEENNIRYIKNDRKLLKGKEIDFLLPDHKFGIEINGTYWHRIEKKNEDYHISKTWGCFTEEIILNQVVDLDISLKYRFELFKNEILSLVYKPKYKLDNIIIKDDFIHVYSSEELVAKMMFKSCPTFNYISGIPVCYKPIYQPYLYQEVLKRIPAIKTLVMVSDRNRFKPGMLDFSCSDFYGNNIPYDLKNELSKPRKFKESRYIIYNSGYFVFAVDNDFLNKNLQGVITV